jgi:hypothetical protein
LDPILRDTLRAQQAKAPYASYPTTERADYGDTCNQTQAPGLSGAARQATKAESIISGLQQRDTYMRSEIEKNERVADILTRHPEFLEFLEVLRSGAV